MRLWALSEANLVAQAANQTSLSHAGKALGGAALDFASSATGIDAAKQVGQVAYQIFQLIKTRKSASKFIAAAMSVPDNQRGNGDVFDVDDSLWGPQGILNERAKLEILKLVETEITKLVNSNRQAPAGFANTIAMAYLKQKVKGLV